MNRRNDNPSAPWADGAIALGVFVVALITRLLFLSTAVDRDWPHSMYYEGDATTWVEWAAALSRGEEFELGLPIRSPGVAYLFHWTQSGTPHDFASFKALWCAVSAAACGLAYLCYVRSVGRRTALIAAALCTFSFGSYVTATSLNNEALYTFVLVVIAWLTLRLVSRPAWRFVIALGVANGVATLLRAEHTLLLLMLVAYVAHRFWWEPLTLKPLRSRLASTTVPAAAIAVLSFSLCLPWSVIGSRAADRMNNVTKAAIQIESAAPPWTPDARAFLSSLPAFVRLPTFVQITREARAAGMSPLTADGVRTLLKQNYGYVPEPLRSPTFVSSQGPLSFALANHPQADGGFSKAALANPFDANPRLAITYPPHLELYNHGYAMGWVYIRDDFGGWLRLVGKKLSRFADGATLGFTARNLPLGLSGVRQPVDLITPLSGHAGWWKAAVILSIVAGVVVGAARRTGGVWMVIIIYKLIVTALFYGYARQAVSILPAFFFFAALFVDQLIRWAEALLPVPLRWQRVIGLAVVLTVLGVDVYASRHAPVMRVDGSHERTPMKWGPGSFESAQRIELHLQRPVQ